MRFSGAFRGVWFLHVDEIFMGIEMWCRIVPAVASAFGMRKTHTIRTQCHMITHGHPIANGNHIDPKTAGRDKNEGSAMYLQGVVSCTDMPEARPCRKH